MIGNLRPFPVMKNSGVPWLGDVPEHWDLRRTKTVLRQRVDKGYPNEPLLAATQSKGVVRKDQYEGRTVLAMKDLHLLKLVRRGDFVISLRSFQGGIEFAREQGIISPAYTVLYPVNPDSQGYLSWLFKSRPFVENLALYVTGIRQGQNIDYEKLSRSELPLPPPPEQVAIARFLDHVDRRIRRYIRAKQKLVNLLEEQKQAIIHRAFTRGLDPNARFKPSGVEWLGELPDRWEVVALRYLCTKFGSGVTPRGGAQAYQATGVPLIRSQNVHFAGLQLHSVARIPRTTHDQMAATHVRPFDVLLNITGASIGRVCPVPEDFEEGNVNQHVCIIRPKRGQVDAAYLALFLSTPEIQTEIYLSQNGSSREGLTLQSIRRLPVLVPPLEEQASIVAWASGKTKGIDSAIKRAEREISLIREYRTRLITDVVTGKFDVRDAAARLSDVPDEPEPIEETEGESDVEHMGAGEVDELPEGVDA